MSSKEPEKTFIEKLSHLTKTLKLLEELIKVDSRVEKIEKEIKAWESVRPIK